MKYDISELLRSNPEPEESESGLDVLLGDELGVLDAILNKADIFTRIQDTLLELISDNLYNGRIRYRRFIHDCIYGGIRRRL